MDDNKNVFHESSDKYKILFEKMLNAFALHKIITDKDGKPTDYEFIEVNEAFEKMTGLKREDILGKNVTDIMPDIKNDKANWIERYGKVATTGEEEHFEDFSKQLKKWFYIYAYSPSNGYFATIFNDVTERKNSEIALNEKIEELQKIIKLSVGRELDLIKLKEKLNNCEQKINDK